ncbi:MAG: OmpA family protein [Polyangiaceae bacterium]
MSMRSPTAALAVALGAYLSLAAEPAAAQEGGFALNQLQPSPAGDTFFGVPSPYAYGHLDPKAYLLFDYAHRPMRLTQAGNTTALVSSQGFLRLDAALALWDRLLVSVDVPLALVTSGDDPGLPGTTFTPLEGPSFGDVRVGVRGRLFGDDGGPFQLGLGSYLFIPSGKQDQYAGEGAIRGAFHAVIGGRVGDDVGFTYSAAFGPELRGSDSPHALVYGGGAAVLFAEDMVQVGAEIMGVTPLSGTLPLSATGFSTTAPAGTNAEVMLSSKLRFLEGLTVGVAGGPGLGSAVGTPIVRAMALIGWTPMPGARPDPGGEGVAQVGDRDDDGIDDRIDACPDVPGEPSADPAKDGCPPADRDADGVRDVDDACPTVAGLANADLTKNGCPPDSDGDGWHDAMDACPQVPGVPSEDPTKNGCPADTDSDGIADDLDACPKAAGDPHDEPAKNGCPPDPDQDGIRYADDACPFDKGPEDPDPSRNGCPRFVTVGQDEILINKRIEFETYGDSLSEAVTSDSAQVLEEVAAAIKARPEIRRVEVQGHTDDSGNEEYNQQLSERRAQAVRSWLVDKGGVPAEKLVAKGYGFTRPIADNRIKTGRQANRRVQFVILDKKK